MPLWEDHCDMKLENKVRQLAVTEKFIVAQ